MSTEYLQEIIKLLLQSFRTPLWPSCGLGFYWGKSLDTATEVKVLDFQGYYIKSETLAWGGITCKTFANSNFCIGFDINYKSFLRDWLGIYENGDEDQSSGTTSLTCITVGCRAEEMQRREEAVRGEPVRAGGPVGPRSQWDC